MRNITLILILGLSALALTTHADPQRFTVVGRDVIFALAEPAGWKMDTESGKKNGIPVVYYPSGETWESASAVMYANTAIKECLPIPSLPAFIDAEIKDLRRRNPALQTSDDGTLVADGRMAVLKRFTGDRHGNHEVVAYIEEKAAFVSITLSAKSAQQFEDAYPAFRELVTSYQYVVGSSDCTQ